MIFSNTIKNTTEIWFIIEKYVPIPLGVPLKPDFIIEWFSGIECYSQIPLTIPLKSDLLLNGMFKYHWEYHWNKILLLNGPIVLKGILKYHWEYHWSLTYYWKVCSDTIESTIETCLIIEWSNGIQRYSQIPLRIPQKSDLLLQSMFKYHWKYHWNMFYHWVVQWCWMVFSYTIESTTENYILPLDGPMVLNGITNYHWEYHWPYWNTIEWSNGIEWYYKLPLKIPLCPTEIPLNGPMVLNGIQWYSMVFNGIPLDLFSKGITA